MRAFAIQFESRNYCVMRPSTNGSFYRLLVVARCICAFVFFAFQLKLQKAVSKFGDWMNTMTVLSASIAPNFKTVEIQHFFFLWKFCFYSWKSLLCWIFCSNLKPPGVNVPLEKDLKNKIKHTINVFWNIFHLLLIFFHYI